MPERSLFLVEPMSLADIDQVMQIEGVSFSAPWSARAYRYEIVENPHSTMLVVRPAPRDGHPLSMTLQRVLGTLPGPVLGYAGAWNLVDELHISTIAVHPRWRRRGLGELLVVSMLERALELQVHRATLEVRVSNLAAQNLYNKYGFAIVSRQKAYYSDNNEDAFIMSTPRRDDPELLAMLRARRAELNRRLRRGKEEKEHERGPR